MKKYIILVFAIFFVMNITAQNSIPNGNFETWNSATYDYPQYYPFNSNPEAFYKCNASFNVVKTTDTYHGSNAIQLTTTATATDTCMAYFINAKSTNGSPSSWKGGIPCSGQPTGIRGYYKYSGTGNDSAAMILSFFKGGVNIGVYFYTIGGNKTAYTLFDFKFSPALPMAPDSFIFGAAASNFMVSNNGVAGSVLKLDSISLTGVSNQPSQLNGDFESWQSVSIDVPIKWSVESGQGAGVYQTTDAAKGSYAMGLKTYLGDNNSVPRANAGMISNAFWDENCMCRKGGYTYSNKKDTLAFYYKYTPVNALDSAQVSLEFKKNGNNLSVINVYLGASVTYKYMEVPFDLFSIPDSVITEMQSSKWEDSALSFIGADFKIDEIHFKSQPLNTGIFEVGVNDIRVYPNPMNNYTIIELNSNLNLQGMDLYIYDILGKNVRKVKVNSYKLIVEKNDLLSGTYIYELKNNSGMVKKGKLLVE